MSINDGNGPLNGEKTTGNRGRVQLTRRQIEVLSWTAQGKTSWEIAMIIKCKEVTVNYHLQEAFRRLGAANRTHAVTKAMELRLLTMK
jgi:LuxR family quorum sensing-dependent transcriptional regulator